MPLRHQLASAAALVAAIALAGPGIASACKKNRKCKKVPDVVVSLSIDADLAATIEVKNTSKRALTLASHVRTHEMHYDAFAVELDDPVAGTEGCGAGDAVRRTRTLTFADSRDKSIAIEVDLDPGQSFTHRIDLDGWAQRAINGGQRLAPGFYNVRVVYDTRSERDVWMGRATSPTFHLTVPGTITTMCKANPGWGAF
jgi:hypothetical protein